MQGIPPLAIRYGPANLSLNGMTEGGAVADFFSFLRAYPTWVQLFLICDATIVVVVLVVFSPTSQNKAAMSGGTVQSANVAGNVGQINNISGVTIHMEQTATSSPAVPPLKERIRTLLRDVSPVVIHAIDQGASSVCVMLSQQSIARLDVLKSEPNFSDFAQVKATGSVIVGNTNRIGDCINDLTGSGMLQGYEIVVRPTLRL